MAGKGHGRAVPSTLPKVCSRGESRPPKRVPSSCFSALSIAIFDRCQPLSKSAPLERYLAVAFPRPPNDRGFRRAPLSAPNAASACRTRSPAISTGCSAPSRTPASSLSAPTRRVGLASACLPAEPILKPPRAQAVRSRFPARRLPRRQIQFLNADLAGTGR